MRTLQRTAAFVGLLSIALTANAANFADVNGTGYETAYNYLSQQGIVEQGRPYAPLNRAEAVKVIVSMLDETSSRAMWYRANMPKLPLFPDVPLNAWFASYVEAAHEKKIVKGYPNGHFHPERLLSVEEAVTMLMRSVGADSSAANALTSQSIQNNSSEWYTGSINAAIDKNLVPSRERLQLGAAITRGQFFSIAYRLHSIRASGLARFDDGSDAQHVQTVQSGNPQAITQLPVINAPQPIVNTVATTQQRTGGIQINAGGNTVSNAQNHQYASEKYFSITIPKVGITDLTITHPVDPFTKDGVLAPLQSGVGHLFSYPGAGGKIMVYGHSSSYPWDASAYAKIFRQINGLQPGDRIYVTYSGTMYVYEVTFEEAIPAADTSRFQDNGSGEELILYTCWPPDDISQRYLVHAIPVGTVALR